MSDLASSKNKVQLESVQTRAPVGESALQTIGGSTNFLLDTAVFFHEFKLNGTIGSSAVSSVIRDGFLLLPKTNNWELYDVSMYGATMGTSGYVEFDVQQSTYPSGAFISIFTTKPQISYNATAETSIHIGSSVTNTVAPVLTTSPLPCSPQDRFKLILTSTQGGSPKNFGLWLYFRARN